MSMWAVVTSPEGPALKTCEPPCPSANQSLVRVELVGICRTDTLVACGRLKAPPGLVLGHEVSAIVERSQRFAEGQRVAINPWWWCRGCAACRSGFPYACPEASMLGLHRPGGLAEWLVIPDESLFAVEFDARHAAYVEPVAATLAAADYLGADTSVVVPGQNRIARLTRRVLEALGFQVQGEGVAQAGVETGPESLRLLTEQLAPGATIVLKSRLPGPADFDPVQLARKQLRLQGAWCGDFARAI
ncbi:MAG: alcohol dehydrogenase catalytic domain-containing protein [Candidatus Eremiobacteraeota bacterium]|nr:alcohol dehydrogenase catalytic domain-containing protein [Candidatus Eremiobacteraeota bacterium]